MMESSRLVTVRLHGPLADTYGGEHQFHIRNPREAIAALDANFAGFKADFIRIESYALLVDGTWYGDHNGAGDVGGIPIKSEVDICPIIDGKVVGFLAPLLVSAFGISTFAANIIGGVLIAGLLFGVAMILSPKPKKKTEEDTKKDENYAFSGPENVTEQGVAVPLIYGRRHAGSVVISAGLELAEEFVPMATTAGAPGDGGSVVIDDGGRTEWESDHPQIFRIPPPRRRPRLAMPNA